MRGTAVGVVIVAVAMGCGREQVPPGEGSAVAGAAPTVEVELFAEGVVSSALPEFATTFSPSGDTVWFNRTPADRSRLELYYAVRSDGAWSEPRPFEPTADFAAIDPFMTPDGERLYFSSNLPREGAPEGEFNLWYLERGGAEWSSPIPLPEPVASDSSDVFNSLAADGTMVFSSLRDGRRRVYETRVDENGWADPVALTFGGVPVASNPAISPDGRFLVFAAEGPADGSDLFVACRTAAGWGEPVRLAEPISSGYTDFAPGVTADFVYFTSERPGVVGPQPDGVRPPGDVYRVAASVVVGHCEGTG